MKTNHLTSEQIWNSLNKNERTELLRKCLTKELSQPTFNDIVDSDYSNLFNYWNTGVKNAIESYITNFF